MSSLSDEDFLDQNGSANIFDDEDIENLTDIQTNENIDVVTIYLFFKCILI